MTIVIVESIVRSVVNMSEQMSVTESEKSPLVNAKEIKAPHHVGGLSVWHTVFFLIAELIGVGALALPNSLARSGYTGVLSLAFSCAIAIYNGHQLGQCWTILLQRYPEYRTHCRYPYAAIGEKAAGKWMKYVVSAAMGFTCLGSCVLYVLMAAQNLQFVFSLAGVNLSFCLWMVVFAVALVPLSWLGSPKDFSWIAVIAVVAATAALILVFGKIASELPPKDTIRHHYPTSIRMYFLSFGAALYAFNGACTFPTIQHDMKEPQKFTMALAIAYIYGLFVYTPVAVIGYYAFGENVSPNVLLSLPTGPIKIIVIILYIFHIIGAYMVFLSPAVQGIEEVAKIPNKKFHWKRILFRTSLVCLILFVAETIPHFGALLDLIGGSSSGFLTFIAPPIFYLLLCKNGYLDSKRKIRTVPLWMKMLNFLVIIIGTAAASTSTYAAVIQLVSSNTFVPPCYLNSTSAQ